MASGLRLITDAIPADENVEDEGVDEDVGKDVYDIGTDGNHEQEDDKVVQDCAVQGCHECGGTLTCHMTTQSSRKNVRQKVVTFAIRVAITNRGTATTTNEVMNPNTRGTKAMGQKKCV